MLNVLGRETQEAPTPISPLTPACKVCGSHSYIGNSGSLSCWLGLCPQPNAEPSLGQFEAQGGRSLQGQTQISGCHHLKRDVTHVGQA